MKQLVIIGGSPAGVKAAQEIRAVDAASRITILLGENHPPFSRQEFTSFLANETAIDKLYAAPRTFYEQNQISLVFNKKISRVNFRKSQVFFEDKDKIDYDVLIVADSLQTKLPDIKGNHRSGVFGLRRMTDVVELSKLLPVTECVVIRSETSWGLKLASALRRREKEVIWVIPGARILEKYVDEGVSQILRRMLEEAGVRLMEQNDIAEVLGDTDVKAVRLKSGKVLASQLIIYPDAGADLKIFKETDLQFNDKISVNINFQSNISNVYAVDDVCLAEVGGAFPWEDSYGLILEQQAKVVTSGISGQGMIAEYPVPLMTSPLQNDLIQFIGQTCPSENTRVLVCAEEDQKKYRQVLAVKDRMVGAVLVNCGAEKERFLQLVREQKSVSEEGRAWTGSMPFVSREESPVTVDQTQTSIPTTSPGEDAGHPAKNFPLPEG